MILTVCVAIFVEFVFSQMYAFLPKTILSRVIEMLINLNLNVSDHENMY